MEDSQETGETRDGQKQTEMVEDDVYWLAHSNLLSLLPLQPRTPFPGLALPMVGYALAHQENVPTEMLTG